MDKRLLRTVKVAGWDFDAQRNVLEKGSEIIRLEPKTSQLLSFMVLHSNEVLSRAKLLSEVWPRMIVSDEVLTNAVNKIRRAFNDDRKNPQIIETIPKTGYRFIASVEEITADGGSVGCDDDAEPAISVPASSTGKTRLSFRNSWIFSLGLPTFAVLVVLIFGLIIIIQQDEKPHSKIDNPSIAVLPFDNLSDEPDQEFLTDGITEDITTDLSRVSNIRVISSSASGRYKGKDIIPQQVGEELTVDYILQGNIRRIGDLIRVNAQLIDTKTGFNHWAKRYDRKVSEIFVIQDEVSTSVVGALNIDISEYEKKGLSHVTKLNIKAYDYFQEGQRAAIQHTKDSYQRAIASYLKAIDIDESYGRAYGAMSYVMAIQFRRGWTDTPRETLDRALELAKTGVKLDNTIPQTYWSLGYVYLMRKELDKAEEAVATAIKIAPGYSDAYGLLALISNNRGEAEKAIEYTQKGMKLNPFYTWDYLYNLGRANYTLKKYNKAVEFLEQAKGRNPNAIQIIQHLTAAYYRAGQVDDAEWQVEEILSLDPTMTISHISKSIPISDEEVIENFLSALKAAGLPE